MNAPLFGYVALWRGRRVEVYAPTLLAAREMAARELRVRPSREYEINVVLAEKGGAPVIHDGAVLP